MIIKTILYNETKTFGFKNDYYYVLLLIIVKTVDHGHINLGANSCPGVLHKFDFISSENKVYPQVYLRMKMP